MKNMRYIDKISAQHSEFSKMRLALENFIPISFTFVLLHTEKENSLRTISSIRQLVYPETQIQVIVVSADKSDSCSQYETLPSFAAACQQAVGEYLFVLRSGDVVYRECLFEFTVALRLQKALPPVAYCDHDLLLQGQRVCPRFKLHWSPDLFAQTPYLQRACVVKRSFLLENLDRVADGRIFRLAGDFLDQASVLHIEGILCSLAGEDEEPVSSSADEEKVASVSVFLSSRLGSLSDLETLVHSLSDSLQEVSFDITVIGVIEKYFKRWNLKKFYRLPCAFLPVEEGEIAVVYQQAVTRAAGKLILFIDENVFTQGPDLLTLLKAATRPYTGIVAPLLINAEKKCVESAGMVYDREEKALFSLFHDQHLESTCAQNLLLLERNCTTVSPLLFAVKKSRLLKALAEGVTFSLSGEGLLSLGFSLFRQGFPALYCPQSRALCKKPQPDRLPVPSTLIERDLYCNRYIVCKDGVPIVDREPLRLSFSGHPTLSRTEIKKILLVKLDHIGDVILSIPIVRQIRSYFPSAEIVVLAAPWCKEIFFEQPEVDRVIEFAYFAQRSGDGTKFEDNDPKEALTAVLKSENFDLVIHLRRHEQTKLLASGCGPYCLAYSTKPEADFISHPVPALDDFEGSQPKWHITDQLFQLAAPLVDMQSYCAPLSLSGKVLARVERYFAEKRFPEGKLLVGIQGSAGNDAKQWPEEYFAELADRLIAEKSAYIILSGNKSDRPLHERILSKMKRCSSAISIAGELPLIDFCAFVRKLDYFIGLDTGPTHICGLQDVAVLQIFSGFAGWREWSPLGKKTLLLHREMECAPCHRAHLADCGHRSRCMQSIFPTDAYHAFERLMLLFPPKHEEKKG